MWNESLLVLRDDEGGKQLEGGHPLAENGEGGEGIAVQALGIDLNDEEQFPALPTQAPVKLNFARKNTLSRRTENANGGDTRGKEIWGGECLHLARVCVCVWVVLR